MSKINDEEFEMIAEPCKSCDEIRPYGAGKSKEIHCNGKGKLMGDWNNKWCQIFDCPKK